MQLNEEITTSPPSSTKTSENVSASKDAVAPAKRPRSRLRKWMIGMGVVLFVFVLAAAGFYLWQKYRPIEQAKLPDYNKLDNRLDTELSGNQKHPIDGALRIAHESLQHIRTKVVDYTATMSKQQRINGKLMPKQMMFAKIRNRKLNAAQEIVVPLSVYLRFVEPHAGREVIWVENQNGGKLLVHNPGVFSFLPIPPLDPTGPLAMQGNRYPITEIGVENLMIQLIDKGFEERKLAAADCVVNQVADADLEGRSCTMIEIEHPNQQPGMEFYLARIYIDNELRIPIFYESFSWPEKEGDEPPLLDRFHYWDLKLNVGLTDMDFDTDNPEYDF